MTIDADRPLDGHDPESPDDGRLAQVLDVYLAEVEAGREVDVETLIEANPAIADRLRDCLGILQAVGQVTNPQTLRDHEATEGWTPLGDYRIIRQVGRGGMGIVYEAEQVSLGRRVALKILPFANALDPPQLARFKLEAQAAAQLHHANIVPIHAIGSERGVHFYAMQFIEGRTLDDLIGDLRRSESTEGSSKPPRPDPTLPEAPDETSSPSTLPSNRGRAYFRAVAELGIQAAEALDHAHRLGIVHRDVKPANLMLDDRGHLWITDFGLARVQSSPGLTSTGNVLGTLRYMSPEQALARREIVDHRADIYSLGATLYELLTLRPVFEGRDRPELLLQIERDEPRPLRRLAASIPPDLETIVLKALAKEPSQRYATAKDLADDLRRHLDHRPIHARRPTAWQRVAKWVRRHQAATASAMVALLISTIVLSVALTLLAAKQRELAREHDEAVRQGKRASNNYGMALDAVSEMLDEVGTSTLQNIPRAEPVRKALLEKALAFYQRLAAEEGNPSLRFETARAYRRVAQINQWLGRPGEAIKAIDRSIEIFEALASERPPGQAAQHEMANAYFVRGTARKGLGDLPGAEASFARSGACYEALIAEAKEVRRYREEYASHMMDQMSVFRQAKRLDDAEKVGRRSLELTRGLLSEVPEDSRSHHNAGGALHNLALIAQQRDDLAGTRTLLNEAIAHQKAALAPNPSEPSYRAFLRNHLEMLAIVEHQSGRPQGTVEAFREIVTIGEGLIADFPNHPEHRRMLAGSLANLALVLGELDRWPEAEREHRRAIAQFEALAAQHPDVKSYATELAFAHNNLGSFLRDRGRTADASGELRRAIELFEGMKDPRPNQIVSTCTALSLLLATGADPKDRDPEQALAFARKAVELAPKNVAARATLGVAQYSSGRWGEAIESLGPMTDDERCPAWPFFYLAMAHHRLGDPAEARQWFDRGVERMNRGTKKPDPLITQARSEAAALLGIDDRPAGTPSQTTGRSVVPE
jgi:eukaryotic-like serine/threonine-protein kinase